MREPLPGGERLFLVLLHKTLNFKNNRRCFVGGFSSVTRGVAAAVARAGRGK
jgi:hypothetical protein